MNYDMIVYNGFEWDFGNTHKIESRVPKQVVEAFFKLPVLYKIDTRHAVDEIRFIAVGYTPEPKRCLFVVYTFRQRGEELLIRPISARYTHKNEEEAYEKQLKKIQANQ